MVDTKAGDSGLHRRRREFESYAAAKSGEIDEQRQSWRYYHVNQITAKQRKIYEQRGQPEIIFDRTSRKIDGLVGIVRKLRTDPKAFPRTQKQEQGAEVATQVIRTICDQSRFEDIEAECARDGAVHGIGVSEMLLERGDHGDPDCNLGYVDPRTFFYDPRSVKGDFSDARYMGVNKWLGLDELDEIIPGASEKVSTFDDGSYYTAHDSDREMLWVDEKKRVRLVDHWYIEGGIWKWSLHVGTTELDGGDSPFKNDKGKSLCKFFAFSNLIDQDGDRYGFIRRLKGPQDAMNQHRSKSIHIMNTRQLVAQNGALEDIEKARREAARPDGVIIYNGDKDAFRFEQAAQEFLQQTQYYEDAKNEIDQFGPNPALLGDLGKSASGRAMAMAQQAGLAEMGPFLKNFRMWKLAQYEGCWWAAQQHWTAERFLRVLDDDGVAQFMPINGMQFDEYGQPRIVNALGSISVDIVIDEGPDTETVMGDVFDTLSTLAQNKVPVPPAALIEASSLPGDRKKKLISMMTQQDPMAEEAKKLELQGAAAKNQEAQSRAMLNAAKARAEGMPDMPGAPQPQEYELPPELQNAQAIADIAETNASRELKLAQARKTEADAMIAPAQAAHEAIMTEHQFQQGIRDRAADRQIASRSSAPA